MPALSYTYTPPPSFPRSQGAFGYGSKWGSYISQHPRLRPGLPLCSPGWLYPSGAIRVKAPFTPPHNTQG